MAERCTVHKVSLLDADKAAADPALAALLSEGWRVISDVPVSDPGDPHVLLFLAPPLKPKDSNWLAVTAIALGAAGTILAALSIAGVL